MRVLGRGNDRTEHRFAQDRLSAYLDGALRASERTRFDRHLARCPQCQWELRSLRQTIQWTRQLPAVPVPRAFTIPVPVRAAPAARPVRRSWGLPALQGATALVAVLFLFAVVGELFLSRTFPATAPQPEVAREAAPAPASEVVVEVTREVQLEAPAAATRPLGTAAPEAAEPTAAVQATVVVEAAVEAAVAATPTPQVAEAPGVGGGLEEEPLTATLKAAAPPPSAPTAAAEETLPAADTAAPEAAAALSASVAAEAVPTPTEPAPTEVAAVALAQQEQAAADRDRGPGRWLFGTVLALGASFVVLGTLTAVLMARRLRAR